MEFGKLTELARSGANSRAYVFRDWFVDFGPCKRKAEGATDPLQIMGHIVMEPGRASQLANMFPDEVSGDGLPEGWGERRVGEILELAYGKALRKEERSPGPFPVYGSGGITGSHDTALVRGPAIVVGRKGTVGSLFWEDKDIHPIDTAYYVESTRPMIYCYYLLQTLGLEHMNTDAAVPGLNRGNVYRLLVPAAPSGAINEFAKLVEPWRKRISLTVAEQRTLAATRDLLIPKLMSGEIHLREAEEHLEEVA